MPRVPRVGDGEALREEIDERADLGRQTLAGTVSRRMPPGAPPVYDTARLASSTSTRIFAARS